MIEYCWHETPLGRMLFVARGECLSGAYFVGQKYEARPHVQWREAGNNPVLSRTRAQMAEYFRGERHEFDVALAPHGTPFQRRVWEALLRIQYRQTTSYGALARSLEMRESVRAVGAAIGRNPISVLIPCHRVLGADGSLTGYAGGLERKQALLALEHTNASLHGGVGQLSLALPLRRSAAERARTGT